MALKKDIYEDNDDFLFATLLSPGARTVKNLTIHDSNDVDYYKITLTNTGMAKNLIKATFTNSRGNLDLKLYDASGKELASSETTKGTETISLKGLAQGVYYAKVYGLSGAQNTYSLTWDQKNYGPKADSYEADGGNNKRSTATELKKVTGTVASRSIHSVKDVDYYKLTLTNIGMAKNLVKIAFTNSRGNLDMRLYRSSRRAIASSTTTNNSESISLTGLAEGTYYLKVYGVSGEQNTYKLIWDQKNYGPKIDSYEAGDGNDTLNTATEIKKAAGSVAKRSIHSIRDVDYYKFALTNIGMAKNQVKAAFTNSKGNLDMVLYNASGKEIAASESLRNSETISLKGLAEGTYYLKVYGVDKAQNTYTLTWDQKNYGPTTDSYDANGGNDTLAKATTLTKAKGTVTARSIHSVRDVDYYKFTLSNTGLAKNLIRTAFTNSKGNLDMKLYNASGKEIASAATLKNGESFSLKGFAAGTYYLKVYGVDNAQNTYSLTWDQTNYGPKADSYESGNGNNTLATAGMLTTGNGKLTSRTIHNGNDADYYKILLIGPGQFMNYVQINTISTEGALDLKLYDASGKELRSSWYPVAKARDISLDGLSAGVYYAKVSGVNGSLGSYTLSWDQRFYLQSLEQRQDKHSWAADPYENNNSISAASTLLASYGYIRNLTIHNSSDVDYYKITLSTTGTSASWVTASFGKITGQMDLALLDSSGNVLRTGGGTNYNHLSLKDLAAGSYYVRVRGLSGAQSTYSLNWNRTNYAVPQPGTDSAIELAAGSFTLGEATPEHYHAFELASAGSLANHIAVSSGEKLALSLLDAKGRLIFNSENAQGKINLGSLDAGHYYLKVEAEGITSGKSAPYSLACDTESSAATAMTVGKGHSSLFAVNSARTEYAYLMGYGNVTLSDFGTSKYAGTRMAFSNDLIIDAEKSVSNTRDNNLCWAGTASNMLAWSGWGAKGISSAKGSTAEDVLFSEYSKYFPDKLGNIADGVRWFFESDYKNYSNSITATAGSGNYLKTSALPGLTSNSVNGVHSLHAMATALDNNMAVGLSMGYYASASSTTRSGGHAVTVWGYTYDITKTWDDVGYYTGLLVSDADDGKSVANATDAANTLSMISLSFNTKTFKYYTKYGASGSKVYKLEDFVTLDHSTDWTTTSGSLPTTATSKIGLTGSAGADLDSLLADAMLPSAESMQASSALTYGNDKYKQNGMLTG